MIETEKKFLIKYPDEDFIASLPGCKKYFIMQTYLKSEGGVSIRVRQRKSADKTEYFKTEKIRISNMSCIENETIITGKEYSILLEKADESLNHIHKIRYAVPYADLIFEIDVFPFWKDRAIMEVELKSEEQKFDLPDFVSIIKDVTDDKRYKNHSMARSVPMDF